MNRKDWLKIAGLLGLGATGFGLAGMGPLAGLLGETGAGVAAGMKGASLASGLAGPTTAGASGAVGVGNALAGAGSGLATAQKIAAPMQMAGLLSPSSPPPMPAPQMPAPQAASAPPQDSNYGYPAPNLGGMKPPNIPQQVWDSLDPATKQKLLMGGMS